MKVNRIVLNPSSTREHHCLYQHAEPACTINPSRESLKFHLLVSFKRNQVRERLQKMGPFQPMNIFLRQEIDRMQRVIVLVRNTLTDLKLAIDGTIIMSENLRDALDCMYDARIPARWKKVGLKNWRNWTKKKVWTHRALNEILLKAIHGFLAGTFAFPL